MLINQELVHKIQGFLSLDGANAIKIVFNGLKVSKAKGSLRRNAYSLEDITGKSGSVSQFLEELTEKGIDKNVQFTLVKMYGSENKTTYHTAEQFTANIKEETMHNQSQPAPAQSMQPPMNYSPTPFGLAAPADMFGKMVDADRVKEYKEQIHEKKEEIKDLKSENRILKEENSSLKIKLSTATEKADLAVQKALLDKQGFLETESGGKMIEALGAILPKALEVVSPKTPQAAAVGMGNPLAHLSPVKQQFVQRLQQVNDEQVVMFNYLLDNWTEDFKTEFVALINKFDNEQ